MRPEKSVSETTAVLYKQFETAMKDLGGNAMLVEEREVTSGLKTLLSEEIKELVIYQTPLIDRFLPKTFTDEVNDLGVEWLPTIPPPDFNEDSYRQKIITADAGLVAADYLIADSGTIVLVGESNRAQSVTLLPLTLIVLATAQQLIPDLHTFHNVMETATPASLQYITGPSRTSDIEKILILGVHGPKELYVVVVK